MAKKVWITALSKELDQQSVMDTLKTYGLQRGGHFWVDDLEKQAWLAPLDKIVDKETVVWIILSSDEDLASPSIRFGLSLLTLSVFSAKGHGFPIFLVHKGMLPNEADLPTPLGGAQILKAGSATLGAKVVAQANMPYKKIPTDYRLDVHALPHGVCFEIGPIEGQWNGAIFGISGGEETGINAQAVGPRNNFPEKSVLNYPSQDMKLDMGNRSYLAWALKNPIDLETSYYAVISGEPESVLFGPFFGAEDEVQNELELFSLRLR